MRSQRSRRSPRRSQSPAGCSHQTQSELCESDYSPGNVSLFVLVIKLTDVHLLSYDRLIFSLQQEVVREVARANGIRHLISMASSEHVIMQNEALVALAIASAIDIGKAISSSSAEFIRQCSSSEISRASRVCWA